MSLDEARLGFVVERAHCGLADYPYVDLAGSTKLFYIVEFAG